MVGSLIFRGLRLGTAGTLLIVETPSTPTTNWSPWRLIGLLLPKEAKQKIPKSCRPNQKNNRSNRHTERGDPNTV